ncbi:MAG TPA: PP0621 family protein [Burkholderiales bacterium]|nr:PP0621 family protein [Burkholderiales bacterium]
MGKYLLLVMGIIVVYCIMRAGLRRRGRVERQDKTIAEDMVRCAQCGMHLPRGESVVVRDRFFCCAEHQRRHDAGS